MTELMIGHCRYCGDPRQVEMEVDAPQEEADIQATEECDCLEAKEARRKRDFHVFAAGSCFANQFLGDIFDVSTGGAHPVYRYAKPLFMEV